MREKREDFLNEFCLVKQQDEKGIVGERNYSPLIFDVFKPLQWTNLVIYELWLISNNNLD